MVAAPAGGYNGPSLDSIIQMSNEQVLASFEALGITPRPLSWDEDDPQLNIASWAPMDATGPVDMVKLRADAEADHSRSLKMALLLAYLEQWIDSLTDGQLIAAVESLENTILSVSEKRYMKVQDMRERVQELVWPTLLFASKLYVWPTNPLTGIVEDGRSRIPRPHDG